MVSLIDSHPLDRLVPLIEGGQRLTAALPGRVTSVMPFTGQHRAVAAALKALGLAWPAPNRASVAADAACLWTGRGQAFLCGADPAELAGAAALTDQSDGWAVLRLDGPRAADVLARLVAVDLRPRAFGTDHVARTGLGHMPSILHRRGPQAFEVWVFRSMAETAVHEMHEAMISVAARGGA